MPQFGT